MFAVLGQCLPGWTKFEKHCYRFETNKFLTWAQARLACTRQGGDLASVMSRQELDFLIYQLKDFAVATLWIGNIFLLYIAMTLYYILYRVVFQWEIYGTELPTARKIIAQPIRMLG